MRPSVWPSMPEKTWSWIAQPNAGRIGRSPGIVPRMTVIASRMSSSWVTSASAPWRLTRIGKARPEPMKSPCMLIRATPARR
jgi:hypothetical protein